MVSERVAGRATWLYVVTSPRAGFSHVRSVDENYQVRLADGLGEFRGELTHSQKVRCFADIDALMHKFNMGVLPVGHTTKQSSKDIAKMGRLQRMYAIAGSAQMANWPRAMLFLANTDAAGVYDLWAVKRWQRVWKQGVDYVKIAHSSEDDKLLWRKASIQQQFDTMAKVNLEATPSRGGTARFIPYSDQRLASRTR